MNKYKPKKGLKTPIKVTKNVNYDEDEDVMDIGGLFGGNTSEEFESEPEQETTKPEVELENDKEEEKEETKNESKTKEETTKVNALGYSAVVNKDFKKDEVQTYISCIHSTDDNKLQLKTRSMHIEFMQNYIKLCDFTKYGFSKSTNKKKTQEAVVSEVISKYRSNIMHYLPFFKINDKDKGYIPLVIGGTSVVELTDHITKVLAISETNYSLDDNHMYILGVNKDNKTVLLQITHQYQR